MGFIKTKSAFFTVNPASRCQIPARANRRVPGKKPIPAVFAAFLISAASAVFAVDAPNTQQNCISFDSPRAGAVFSAPSWTVSLNVACEKVLKVELHAQYFMGNSDRREVILLGTFTRPPYKLIWNTSNYPNQLLTGAVIEAEATLQGGATQLTRQEGIFLTHRPIVRKSIPVPYALNVQPSLNNAAFAQKFDMGAPHKSAVSVVVWNEKGMVFHVSVDDPSFDSKQPGRNMADAGLEVLIDPARRRSPYPTGSDMFFVIPLRSTPPYRVAHSAEIEDGAFRLVHQTKTVNNPPPTVGLRPIGGYSITFTVPREAFGRAMPDTFAANMALRVFDDNGQVRRISLTDGGVREMHSPFSWHDYHRLPKPLLMNITFQWLIFSALGFLLSLGVYALIIKIRKPQLLSNFERSEEDKSLFERVNRVIEQELVKADLTLEHVASKCGMEPLEINGLIKRSTGFNFMNYLQFCRTEVAKERLRSSRLSEKTIADLCGFANAIEMERCFAKFHHTTPYRFRNQQQVA